MLSRHNVVLLVATFLYMVAPAVCQVSNEEIVTVNGSAPSWKFTNAPVHAPLLTPDELPPLRQRHMRVLAAITGVWDVGIVKKDPLEMTALLYRLLDSYVHACEAGFEVHVVLVTLHTTLTPLTIPQSRFSCFRLGSDIPIAVDRHEFEPLPDNTYGTKSTLAAKHRLLFAAKANAGYDLFVLHEDDILVTAANMHHFLKYGKLTPRNGIYPLFAAYEVPAHPSRSLVEQANTWVSYAWRFGYLKQAPDGEVWFLLRSSAQAMYMLTAEMLATVAQDDDWVNPLRNLSWVTDGRNQTEFNPCVAAVPPLLLRLWLKMRAAAAARGATAARVHIHAHTAPPAPLLR